ncbi:hypothetical protein FOA52_006628 [Chlamydomonas sp. UWO 241]|nr:hypothetical protein FOA52_006628 [Chlamydomonas sp. UWO 241]
MPDIWYSSRREIFCKDKQMEESGAASITLAFNTDGVCPFKSHTFWPVALRALNFSPWHRNSLVAHHLRMIIPGPNKPADFQPFMEILVDELLMLYWFGAPVTIPADVGPAPHAGAGPAPHAMAVPTINHTAAMCRAMVISALGDYPAQTATENMASQPAHQGACYKCTVPGLRGPCSNCTIYPFASTDTILFGRAGSAPPPIVCKNNEYCMNAARAADHSPYKRSNDCHPARSKGTGTGIYNSHCFQQLPYWDEAFREVDPAHNISNEIKGICDMFTGRLYQQPGRLFTIYEYERDFCDDRFNMHTFVDGGTICPAAKKTTADKKKERKKKEKKKEQKRAADHFAGSASGLPFTAFRSERASDQLKEGTTRATDLMTDGMLPTEVAYKPFQFIFATPGFLKIHDWHTARHHRQPRTPRGLELAGRGCEQRGNKAPHACSLFLPSPRV